MKSINSQAQSGPEAFSLLLLSHFYAWFLNQHHQLINHHHLSNATFGEGKTNFKVFVKFFENHLKSLKKCQQNIEYCFLNEIGILMGFTIKSETCILKRHLFILFSIKAKFHSNETLRKIVKYCVVQKYILETPCVPVKVLVDFYSMHFCCYAEADALLEMQTLLLISCSIQKY